ncbi:MAG: glycosyltransferase [Bacteroidetes bacterium]|nr:MAG: glycosyltransferase [Bacteroidota bacterium]
MNYKTKTLVILTPGFAKDESDSTCLPMQQSLIRCMNKMFPHLNIIILAFQYPYVKKIYKWHGNTVISFNGRNRGGLSKLILFQKWNTAIKKNHRENKIDGLLSFWYTECAFAGKRFADKYNVTHYCWMWGQDAKKGNKYVSLARLRSDELIAFSDFMQDEFKKNYGIKPLHVITPGIDINEFSFNNVKKDIDVIAAGSLIPLKQYDVFIQVVAYLKISMPLIKAVLIGGGPEKNRLQDLIESAGLQSNITMTGELSHPDVLQWMQRGKIFLHPSSYEGFGIVCIEALCSGAEVISFVKPMHTKIENWHIATTKEEMILKATEILATSKDEYKSIILYRIEQTVEKMAQLFSF